MRFQILLPVFLLCASLSGAAGAADKFTVAEMQRLLSAYGFDTGQPDGILGPRTRAAISAYQAERGLTVTGSPTANLLSVLRNDGLLARPADDPPQGAVQQLAPIRYPGNSLQPLAEKTPSTKRTLSPSRPSVRHRPLNLLAPSERTQQPTPRPVLADERAIRPPSLQPAEQTANQRPQPQPQEPAHLIGSRHWLFEDRKADGTPIHAPFGVFLENGGSVVGPEFAERMLWNADEGAFSLTYRSVLGQQIERRGRLLSPSRLEGTATAPGRLQWNWTATANPIGNPLLQPGKQDRWLRPSWQHRIED